MIIRLRGSTKAIVLGRLKVTYWHDRENKLRGLTIAWCRWPVADRGLWDTARDWLDDLVECAAEPCKWGVGVYCPLDENDPIWCSSCFARAVLARLDDQGKKIMDGRETGGSS